MDYRKSHNFDSNIIARNLDDFVDDYSDDSVDLDQGSDEEEYESEEEVELDALEKESIAAHSGAGGKRPSRALEQLMMGIDINKELAEEQTAPKRKQKSKASGVKTRRDSYDKAVEAQTMLLQATKNPSKRDNSSGRPSWEAKVDEIASKSSEGSKKLTAASPAVKAEAAPRARRGKRSEMVKSSSEAHRARHHAHQQSPGRRPRGLQHRAASDANVIHNARRPAAMQHHHRSNSSADVATQRSGSMMQHDEDGEKSSSASRQHHHHVRRNKGHGHHRSTSAERPSRRSDDEDVNEPIPHDGSGHGRRRQLRAYRNTSSESTLPSDGAAEDVNEPIPRGSGHRQQRRQHRASGGTERRKNARSPMRQTSQARRKPVQAQQQHHHHHESEKVNAKVLSGEGTGLKW